MNKYVLYAMAGCLFGICLLVIGFNGIRGTCEMFGLNVDGVIGVDSSTFNDSFRILGFAYTLFGAGFIWSKWGENMNPVQKENEDVHAK
jgi:hypothetical protein